MAHSEKHEYRGMTDDEVAESIDFIDLIEEQLMEESIIDEDEN